MFCTVAIGRYSFERCIIPSPLETPFNYCRKFFVPAQVFINNNPVVFYIFYDGNILIAHNKRGLCCSTLTYIPQSLPTANNKTILRDNLLACSQDWKLYRPSLTESLIRSIDAEAYCNVYVYNLCNFNNLCSFWLTSWSYVNIVLSCDFSR